MQSGATAVVSEPPQSWDLAIVAKAVTVCGRPLNTMSMVRIFFFWLAGWLAAEFPAVAELHVLGLVLQVLTGRCT